ncbi:transcriptional regulator [Streptomyces inusitatus]|uniref:Transcriptional regulator n=1 Tax=Streptomyces inusitatus TaxID=68221 RepID=A0A918V3K8_9ACTN|nr:LuxR family transcriptional regulator [Streptomyces inusitatus]GGZ64370.1 transcriptional regulator [Streptomyces inusitatus]
MLVERDEQIGKLTSFLSGAPSGGASGGRASGAGRIAVISGPVASGKTALLHRVLEHPERSGADRTGPGPLSALASPAERSVPFGVVEQLLRDVPEPEHAPAPTLAPRPDPAAHRAGPVTDEILRSFHARLAGLRARGPLLITVDDAQYADPESLECLAYALLRAPAQGAGALSLVVTRGPDPDGGAPAVLDELPYRLRGLHLRLRPLSVEGVALLLADRPGPETGPGPGEPPLTAESLHAATGGNPLLVRAVLADLRAGRTPPGEAETGPRSAAEPVDAADGAAPHAGERFLHSALICVHRADAEGPRIARGIALLGGAGSLSLLARLMETEERTAARVVTALGEAGVLDGPRFRHPGVRAAVAESLPEEEVIRLRRRAARLLYEDGAAPLMVAVQLLSHEEAAPHEPWVPRVLSEAAHAALATRRMAFAIRCLRTAESRCADEAERMRTRATLARFLWRVKPSAWAQQLRSLTGAVRAGLLPPADTLRLVSDLLWNGWVDDAAEATRQVVGVLPDSPDPAVAVELRRLWLILSSTYPGTLERIGDLPALATRGAQRPSGTAATVSEETRLTGIEALYGVLAAAPDGGARGLADAEFADSVERLLAGTRVRCETIVGMWAGLVALMYADQLDRATRWADQLVAEAADHGAPGWSAVLRAVRAHMSLRRGCLAEARTLAEEALEQLPPHGWGVCVGMPLSALIETRTAMGDHEAAAELVDRPVPEAMFMTRYGLHYLYARGRHQLAVDRHHAALTDFMHCGELMRRWNLDRSGLAPWRLGVAEAWLALGDRPAAERFAREQLAGDAGGRVRGLTLRVLAAARPAAERPDLLGEAVSLLQEAGDWHGLALALTDLGEVCQELGETAQSKLHTRRAWRIAEGCGAKELCRPRPSAPAPHDSPAAPPRTAARTHSGTTSSLTEAERKVAALAAHGYTNREISARLFITISTVEQHLTRVYRKINISHRQDLPVSLDTDVAHTA